MATRGACTLLRRQRDAAARDPLGPHGVPLALVECLRRGGLQGACPAEGARRLPPGRRRGHPRGRRIGGAGAGEVHGCLVGQPPLLLRLLCHLPAHHGAHHVPLELEKQNFIHLPAEIAANRAVDNILHHKGAQQEVTPLTSGRLSHSSGPLNGTGSLTDSPPISPSNADDLNKYNAVAAAASAGKPQYRGGNKTVGRWLKDRRERKKEETRAQNAQLHAAVSVAGVASAIAAIAAATAAGTSQGAAGKDEQAAKTDMAVASAATLVAAHCVEAAEAMGAEREHLASVVGSAVNVRTPGDIVTLTAAAATALRGAATLKARALKEVWNVAAVVPVEKGGVAGHGHDRHRRRHQQQLEEQQQAEKDLGSSGELLPDDNFLGLCSQDLLARGTELLKRTRKGALHWKTVSAYINKTGQVMLKMKSRYAAGTITKKKKSVVADVCKDIPAWPGRHLLEGGEQRRYFGLKTTERRVIEFECRSQRDYEIWTQGVSRLLDIAAAGKRGAA